MKNIYFLLIFLASVQAQAQQIPAKGWCWGYSLGLETQTMGIETLDDKEPEETAVLADRNQPGATLGLYGRKNLWKNWAFQTGLGLSINSNRVIFRPDGKRSYRFTDLEMPLHFQYVHQKNENAPLRGKLLFGVRGSWNVSASKEPLLELLRERTAFDLGLGIEFGKGRWRWSPEVVYSHGINNIHDVSNSPYDLLVGRAVRDKLAFRLTLYRYKHRE